MEIRVETDADPKEFVAWDDLTRGLWRSVAYPDVYIVVPNNVNSWSRIWINAKTNSVAPASGSWKSCLFKRAKSTLTIEIHP